MSGAEIILLCEDTQTDSFVRNFLKHRNFGRYDIDTCPLSNGSGAGKQWVLERYPEQLQLIRKKKNAYLIVIIDADKDTIDDCHKRLEAACRDKSIPPRDKKDSNVLHIIPRRNIETWLAYLDNRNGNLEKRRYEGSRRKSWYRDRRVKRAWNSRGPHDASRCLLRHLHPFDTIPPRHRRAPSLSQRPGRLSSNDNPTIATTPSDHYTCTNPYLC